MLMGFNACDPNEDIYDGLPNNDSTYLANMNKIEPVPEYTLTEPDYELSSNEAVANYKNFSESAPAKEYLPEIINALFLTDAGSELVVNYNYYESLHLNDTIPTYELDSADYPAYPDPGGYYNFSSYNSLYGFLGTNYPDAEKGDIVTLTYAYYFGGGVTDTVPVDYVSLGDEEWTYAYELTSDDYTAMGQTYPNFGDKDDAEFRVPIYLQSFNSDYIDYQYAKEGDVIYILYNLYDDGTTTQEVLKLEKSASDWDVIGSVTEQSADFTSGSDSWNMVPPIDFIKSSGTANKEYTLTKEDYEMVGNGQYHNFDETDDVVLEKISTVLKAHPELEIAIGDIILVHYDYYSGAVTELDMTLEAIAAE